MVSVMVGGKQHREIKTRGTVLGFIVRAIDEDCRIDERWKKLGGEKSSQVDKQLKPQTCQCKASTQSPKNTEILPPLK